MRTTLTLTPEAQALIEARMRETGRRFKEVVNDAIVTALRPTGTEEPFVMPTFRLGWTLTPEEMHRLDEEEEVQKLDRIARGLGGSGAFD